MRDVIGLATAFSLSFSLSSCGVDERPNPYEYHLEIHIDSLEIISGDPTMLRSGARISVSPNYIYISPHVLDMSREVNHQLAEIGRARVGQQLIGTLALTSEGAWLLMEGGVADRVRRSP